MKVTITVENGDQDVEVSRTSADIVRGGGQKLNSIAPLLDLAVADMRRACDVEASS